MADTPQIVDRYALKLPTYNPETPEQVAENWRALERWANQLPLGWQVIERQVLTATGGISFTNIPPSYIDLRLVGSVRGSGAVVGEFIFCRFNGDGGANQYIHESVRGATTVVSSAGALATGIIFGRILGNSAAADMFAAFSLDIPDYANTTRNKVVTGQGTGTDSSGSSWFHASGGGLWQSTAAINRIDFFSLNTPFTFVAGSTVTLLGLVA